MNFIFSQSFVTCQIKNKKANSTKNSETTIIYQVFILCALIFFPETRVFTHLFNKYVPSTNYVPGIVLAPRDTKEDKTKS